MPVGELIGEVIGGVLKVVGRIFFEVVFELLILGTGRLLIRCFRPRSDPSDLACGMVGVVFWGAVGAGVYAICRASAF